MQSDEAIQYPNTRHRPTWESRFIVRTLPTPFDNPLLSPEVSCDEKEIHNYIADYLSELIY